MKLIGLLCFFVFLGVSLGNPSPASHFTVYLFNDDVHTYDEVISGVEHATGFSRTAAEALVNIAGTDGQAPLEYCETQSDCDQISEILKEHKLDTVVSAPGVIPSKAIAFAVREIYTLPDKVADAEHVLKQLAQYARQEPGNIRFDLLQDSEDPTHFTILEQFKSAAAYDQHTASSHYAAVDDALTAYLDTRLPQTHRLLNFVQ
eukprot:TRINITY_DN3005_c0_g1_i2.p1 TRINITY_DN3005_c0_g1~~TRINITY_DN3005_c0_g1_i2.p1  ORF type:complete len:204 (-),score=37.64 TRINITY_DN3005_c0_g1_i2:121-732(-)